MIFEIFNGLHIIRKYMSNVLLGGAIGDALGMPFENKLANYEPLVKWDGKTYLSSESHELAPGQFTDDSQMQQMIAESLINNHGFNPDDLAERYKEWISSGRARGYGRTTLMAITNLLNGKHWSQSGIPGSYGNGSAMRSAPFGIYFRNDIKSLVAICKIDNSITHASEEAEAGSIAIALATAYLVNNDIENLLERICEHLPDSKVKRLIYSLDALIYNNNITAAQALRVLGTKANVIETVPSALYCLLKFDDYHDAVITAIKAGGDTDTTAAIVGSLFGAKKSMKGINRYLFSVEDFDKLVELDSKLYNRSDYFYFRK